ncbi:MAG: cytochrome c biogenesis protein CcdA [Polyangiaceae bacterium]
MRLSRRTSLRASPGLLAWMLGAATFLLVLKPLVAVAASSPPVGSDTSLFQHALARGALAALGASYLFGLATSLTPCVYPMIAVTVSVFGARQTSSRLHGTLLSLTFVLGIVCLFTPLGVASAFLGRGFGSALGDPRVVAIIAVVFLSLAASLFGAFELTLPSSINNRLSGFGGAGFGGAFFLGLICGVVAAPCVGPFLFGLLGWIATTRNITLGSAAMAVYGLGLGTLFFLVGAFALHLPKAGAWMMGIKWAGGVVLAFLALAYLRDAFREETIRKAVGSGLAYGVAGCGLFFIGLALGVVHVAAERRRSPIAHLSRPFKLASILPAVVGLLLVTTWWQVRAPMLEWESSEPSAIIRSASEHRPLLIDFGANWCAACKELERETFPDPRVQEEGARFVALHVDATDEEDPEVMRVRQKYEATEGLPVLVLLRSDGKEALRFTEFVSAERLAEALASVP